VLTGRIAHLPYPLAPFSASPEAFGQTT